MPPSHPGDDEVVQSLVGLDDVTRPIHKQRVLEARVTFWSAIVLLAIGTLLLVLGALGGSSQILQARAARWRAAQFDRRRLVEALQQRSRQARPVSQRPGCDAHDSTAIQDFAKFLRDDKVSWWRRLIGR
jgi:hypothetical protein